MQQIKIKHFHNRETRDRMMVKTERSHKTNDKRGVRPDEFVFPKELNLSVVFISHQDIFLL